MTNSDLEMGNKLLCTFTPEENVDNLLNYITKQYTLTSNKVFVLYIKSNNEYVITYNLDSINSNMLDNTISVHRKKESNTLYTLNGLNEIVKALNNGIVDPKFSVNWVHYRNSIILTREGELKILKTKIYRIIDL
jgi:hypothetical protein